MEVFHVSCLQEKKVSRMRIIFLLGLPVFLGNFPNWIGLKVFHIFKMSPLKQVLETIRVVLCSASMAGAAPEFRFSGLLDIITSSRTLTV